MRFTPWKKNPSNPAMQGKTRCKIKFLFFPLKIDKEIRWLEFAAIEQTRDSKYIDQPREFGPSGYYHFWKNTKWLNK